MTDATDFGRKIGYGRTNPLAAAPLSTARPSTCPRDLEGALQWVYADQMADVDGLGSAAETFTGYDADILHCESGWREGPSPVQIYPGMGKVHPFAATLHDIARSALPDRRDWERVKRYAALRRRPDFPTWVLVEPVPLDERQPVEKGGAPDMKYGVPYRIRIGKRQIWVKDAVLCRVKLRDAGLKALIRERLSYRAWLICMDSIASACAASGFVLDWEPRDIPPFQWWER